MTTVLYVHGLESGPQGAKAKALQAAGFTVVSGQMPCNRRAVLTDPVVMAVLTFTLAVIIAASWSQGSGGFLLATVSVAVLQRFVRPLLMRRTFRRSVDVQRRLLASHSVDVVLGSSFGGAVSLELLATGLWAGPTVLLCPAQQLVATRAWRPSPTIPSTAQQVLVVHARQDAVVPVEHSRRLVKGTSATLHEVDDDHRLSNNATPANLRSWVLEALEKTKTPVQ